MPTSTVVKIGMVGAAIHTETFVPGSTVEQAIKQAGFNPTGFDCIVNGAKVTDLSRPAAAGDMVILSRQVKGNGLDLAYATIHLTTKDGREQQQLMDPAEHPTVRTVLDQAGIKVVHGEEGVEDGTGDLVDLDEEVHDGMYLRIVVSYPAPVAGEDDEQAARDLARAAAIEEAEELPRGYGPPADPGSGIKVVSRDPVAIRKDAEGFAAAAVANREEAARLLDEANHLAAKASIYKAVAAEIEGALQDFERAKDYLRKLGIPTNAPVTAALKQGLTALPKKTLVQIAEAMEVEVAKTATKANIATAILAAE